eukprot:8134151-Alexandrium_andersonii.AAC.1
MRALCRAARVRCKAGGLEHMQALCGGTPDLPMKLGAKDMFTSRRHSPLTSTVHGSGVCTSSRAGTARTEQDGAHGCGVQVRRTSR